MDYLAKVLAPTLALFIKLFDEIEIEDEKEIDNLANTALSLASELCFPIRYGIQGEEELARKYIEKNVAGLAAATSYFFLQCLVSPMTEAIILWEASLVTPTYFKGPERCANIIASLLFDKYPSQEAKTLKLEIMERSYLRIAANALILLLR